MSADAKVDRLLISVAMGVWCPRQLPGRDLPSLSACLEGAFLFTRHHRVDLLQSDFHLSVHVVPAIGALNAVQNPFDHARSTAVDRL